MPSKWPHPAIPIKNTQIVKRSKDERWSGHALTRYHQGARCRVGEIVMATGSVIDPIAACGTSTSLKGPKLAKQVGHIKQNDAAGVHAGK